MNTGLCGSTRRSLLRLRSTQPHSRGHCRAALCDDTFAPQYRKAVMHYKISGVASCVCTSGKVRHETTTAGGNEEFIWLDRRLCGQQNQRCVNIWSVMMESQLRSEAERKDHRSQTFRVYKCRSAYMDDTVIEVLELCSGEHGATQWSGSQTNRGDIKRGNGDFEARVSRHAVRLATRGWTLHQ